MPEHTAALSSIIEPREAIQAAGKILTGFLKSGPRSTSHLNGIQEQIAKIVSPIVTTSEKATENYAATCEGFLEKVKQVRGVPTRVISGDSGSGSDTVSSSGDHISKKFPALLPSIMDYQMRW
jgi:hypothetical protein